MCRLSAAAGGGVDHREHLVFAHDEIVLLLELDLLARVLAEQDEIACLDIERHALALVVALAVASRDDGALLRLFLRAVGNDDAAGALFAFGDSLNDDA